MAIYPTRDHPLTIRVSMEIQMRDVVSEQVTVSMTLDNLSEANEDKLCEIFREKLGAAFSSVRPYLKRSESTE